MDKDFQRSLGLELSGPRSTKSVLCSLDSYPQKSRWVLSQLHVFRELHEKTPDIELIEQVNHWAEGKSFECTGIGINAPLSFPPYLSPDFTTKLPLPEQSTNEEVQWMNQLYEKIKKKTPSARSFVPYLQRPAEIYLRTATPERFSIADGFSATGAPLAARARFLCPYFNIAKREIYVRGSVLRLCQSLKMPKFVEHGYSSLTNGLEARHEFFVQLQKSLPKLFLYDEHIEAMTLHLYMFNAFVTCFTQHLATLGLTELPPPNFPKASTWIHIPKSIIDWDKLSLR